MWQWRQKWHKKWGILQSYSLQNNKKAFYCINNCSILSFINSTKTNMQHDEKK